MYKERDLKPYFSDFFSRKNYIKQRKIKTKTLVCQNKTKIHERFCLSYLYFFSSLASFPTAAVIIPTSSNNPPKGMKSGIASSGLII